MRGLLGPTLGGIMGGPSSWASLVEGGPLLSLGMGPGGQPLVQGAPQILFPPKHFPPSVVTDWPGGFCPSFGCWPQEEGQLKGSASHFCMERAQGTSVGAQRCSVAGRARPEGQRAWSLPWRPVWALGPRLRREGLPRGPACSVLL